MFIILGALTLVGALVGYGVKQAIEPTLNSAKERQRLLKLKQRLKASLTLDDAEDGLVLARRYKDGSAEAYFAPVVEQLRRKRPPI